LAPPIFPTSILALQTSASSQPWPQQVPATIDPASAPGPARQPWNERIDTSTLPPEAAAFFRPRRRFNGCAFCTWPGHRLRECPSAIEYIKTGQVTVKNNRLFLPNGGPIPNDGSGRGLKHAVDTWTAANSALPVVPGPATSLSQPPPPPFFFFGIILLSACGHPYSPARRLPWAGLGPHKGSGGDRNSRGAAEAPSGTSGTVYMCAVCSLVCVMPV